MEPRGFRRGGHDQGPGEGHDLCRPGRSRWARTPSISRSAPCAGSRSRASGSTATGHRGAVRRFIGETGYVTVAERPLDPADYPDADPPTWCRAHWSSARPAARSTWATSARGGATSRMPSGAPRRVRRAPRAGASATPSPTSPTRTPPPTPPGRARLPRNPRERAARGGLEGARSSRGAIAPGGRLMANTWQGSSPGRTARRRLRGHLARGDLRTQRLRAVRHDGQRVGVDPRLLRHARRAARRAARAARPASCPVRTSRGASSRAARICAPELLSALPPRRAPGRGGRHLDDAHRLSLRVARARSRRHLRL